MLLVDDADQSITLKLARRKNKYCGSSIKRSCWCLQGSPETCPYHVLGAKAVAWQQGTRPFQGVTAAAALCKLRLILAAMGVADHKLYRTQDLRRGHTRDLQARGATLKEILEAGQWRGPAFLKYMDLMQLECDVVVEAHMDDSSDDDQN